MTGNPIDIGLGNKFQIDTDYASASAFPLMVERTYNQSIPLASSTQSSAPPNDLAIFLDGAWTTARAVFNGWASTSQPAHNGWSTGYQRSLIARTNPVPSVTLQRANGGAHFFSQVNGAWVANSNVPNRLVQLLDGGGNPSGWRYVDSAQRTVETYDPSGRLISMSNPAGLTQTLAYDTANRLASVSDAFGRRLTFTYDGSNRVATVTDPANGVYSYGYGSQGVLASVTYPDNSQRTYLYENASIPNGLTGVVDERGARFATYGYDAQGKASSTEHAGATSKYQVVYGTNAATVTDPLGTQRSYNFQAILDTTALTSQGQPGGSGCLASTSSQSLDANGNLSQRDDFNGTRTCYTNDPSRSLETTRIEGLSTATTCSTVTPANATLPVNTRRTSTQWHPDWALVTQVTEPGRITTSVYNGQPDPLNANAVASCAPATAKLPDGKPIAVLCKQVEQATTDADGHLGFSAALQAGVPSRQSTWTYNQWGQVLSEDGPRTDVNDITTYTYYSDTTADHTVGDLQSVTNAADKVTSYSKYNKHGQLLESTDPNGVLSVNTYDLRQRLLSTTVGGQTTTYSYDAAGQPKKVTLPDTSWVGYDYDDAHRQIAVYDNKGNRTDYVLDNAGNRTGETTKDPNAALKRQLSRSIDALGRVQQTTGRE